MSACVKGPLKPEVIRKLHHHKYNATGISILEPCLQPFWNWLVTRLPMWLAPNTITFTGLVLNVFSTIILMCYSPNGDSEIPSWALLFTAFCLFVYQTLDAIDGKQARRTNSSSPLGELFDHGCDAFSVVFLMVSCSLATGLGEYPACFLFQCSYSCFIFYCAHWQVYVTGQMRFAIVDVVEAQLIITSLLIVSAFTGIHFWSTLVFGWPLKLWAFTISLVSTFPQLVRLTYNCARNGAGKNGATVANTSVVFPAFPIMIVLFLCFSVANKSPENIYANNKCLFVCSFGMAIAKITQRIVVAQMTKSELSLLDSALIGPLMLFLNQYFDCPLNELFVLWCCCIFCTCDVIKYSTDVCRQISNYLNLRVFSITALNEEKKCGDNGVSGSLLSEQSSQILPPQVFRKRVQSDAVSCVTAAASTAQK